MEQTTFNPKSQLVQRIERQYPLGLMAEQTFFEISINKKFSELIYFESGWGSEWTRKKKIVEATFSFQNIAGRSSANVMPYFTLKDKSKYIDFAIGISSNYKVELIMANEELTIRISHSHYFETIVDENYQPPYVLVHCCQDDRMRYINKHIYTDAMLPAIPNQIGPLYNHWWAYEDMYINSDNILENARIAKQIGLTRLVLDAGWFGNSSATEPWFDIRGDWQEENRERFPEGIAKLAKDIRDLDLQFGIWCEIEGLGVSAQLNQDRPKFVAKCDDKRLGYVCLASNEAQEWAYEALAEIIEKYQATYIKVDFNLDPNAGCNSEGHSHAKYDGLSKHYQGIYNVLNRIRANYQDVIIENCSSGGQRFDIEMISHSDINFLSDPDDIERHFNCLQYATLWIHPKHLLHFIWSNTVETNGLAPFENLDLENCSKAEILYYLRATWMHQWGISHRLEKYSLKVLDILTEAISDYKSRVLPAITAANFYPVCYEPNLKIYVFEKEQQICWFVFSQKAQTVQLSEEKSISFPEGKHSEIIIQERGHFAIPLNKMYIPVKNSKGT